VKGVDILLRRKGKLTVIKSKSSRLPYGVVVSLPLESILSNFFRYESDLSDSVVSIIWVHQDISSEHNCENYGFLPENSTVDWSVPRSTVGFEEQLFPMHLSIAGFIYYIILNVIK
jgi:hypothetical protein